MAEAADLKAAAAIVGGVRAKFSPKPATPAYVQYQQPPLSLEGSAVDLPSIEGFRVRFTVFDYGVISLRLTQDFAGTWSELTACGHQLVENEALEGEAEQGARMLAGRLQTALSKPRQTLLSEDYIVFAVNELSQLHDSEDLITHHGDAIASLLRGELAPLSRQERDEIMRHRLSYLADDLVIPTWNTAFVYDSGAGTQAAIEIAEFANSQLLQFRYYDDLLDDELARIYGLIQRPRRFDWLLLGGHYARAARQVHALFIDVNELTDRTENALKIIGDVYAARLFNILGARLDLDRWKTSVREKLNTLDDIYRFSVEQVGMLRGQFLEVIIVLLIVLEVALFFIGGGE